MVLADCACIIGPVRFLTRKERRSAPRHLKTHKPGSDALDNFKVLEVLGRGSFGTAHRVQCITSGRECVLKITDRCAVPSAAALDLEVAVHASLDHPHVVRIYESFSTKSDLNIIMELCRGGELVDFLDRCGFDVDKPCTEMEAHHLTSQITSAVHYMHCQGIAHRDLKLSNFLVKEHSGNLFDCTVKLIDFGLATYFKPAEASMRTVCGSPGYMAPEVFLGSAKAYDEKCDVFGCGAILFVLLSGLMPFSGETSEQLIQRNMRCAVVFEACNWKNVSQEARRLVARMMCRMPAKRLSTKDVLESAWMQGMTDSDDSETMTLDMIHRVREYGQQNAFQQVSRFCVAYQLDGVNLKQLQRSFNLFDTNSDGRLTKDEMFEATTAFFPKMKAERFNALFEQADLDKNGSIEWTEFLAAVVDDEDLSEEAFWAAFRGLDSDGDGIISLPEMREAIQSHDIPTQNSRELEESFKAVDVNADGRIDFSEFCAMMRLQTKRSHKGLCRGKNNKAAFGGA